MRLLRIALSDDGSMGGEVELRDGRVVSCSFSLAWCDRPTGDVKPNVFDMDLSGVDESRRMSRAVASFSEASFELSEAERSSWPELVKRVPWSDAVRLVELRLDRDSVVGTVSLPDGSDVLVTADSTVDSPGTAVRLSDFSLADERHREAIRAAFSDFLKMADR